MMISTVPDVHCVPRKPKRDTQERECSFLVWVGTRPYESLWSLSRLCL